LQGRLFTFNYDRSLEQFLFTAIVNTFGASEVRALAELNRIEIRHAYGLLGDFAISGVSDHARQYSHLAEARAVRAAASRLTIIQRTTTDDQIFQEARCWFEWSEEVYFLGFGFDELNCQRLNFPSVLAHRRAQRTTGVFGPRMFATCLGMSTLELERAIARIDPTEQRIHTLAANCHDAIVQWSLGAR
jgi:hypothetical protein